MKAAERLNEIGAHEKAIALIAEVFSQCPPFARLRWPAVVAHRALSHFDQAIAEDTLLIESAPLDHDYWSWRAQDRASSKDANRAHADFWIATSRTPYRNTALRLEELWQETSPCDAWLALRYHADALDDEDLLENSGEIEPCLGTGHAKIKSEDRESDALVGGQKARFSLTPEGLTVITSTLAAKAGVTLGEATTVLVEGEAVKAHLARATVKLRGLEVKDARVAVVDWLPEKIDGVIGLDFVSHFLTEHGEKALDLKGR